MSVLVDTIIKKAFVLNLFYYIETAIGVRDYCVDPLDIATNGTLRNVAQNFESGAVDVLNHCEGDCDTNGECFGDLRCYDRDEGDEDDIPGCTGVPYRAWYVNLYYLHTSPLSVFDVCFLCFHQSQGLLHRSSGSVGCYLDYSQLLGLLPLRNISFITR